MRLALKGLNMQHYSWKNLISGVPQGSISVSLFFLIYLIQLFEGLKSLVADGFHLVSVGKEVNVSQLLTTYQSTTGHINGK